MQGKGPCIALQPCSPHVAPLALHLMHQAGLGCRAWGSHGVLQEGTTGAVEDLQQGLALRQEGVQAGGRPPPRDGLVSKQDQDSRAATSIAICHRQRRTWQSLEDKAQKGMGESSTEGNGSEVGPIGPQLCPSPSSLPPLVGQEGSGPRTAMSLAPSTPLCSDLGGNGVSVPGSLKGGLHPCALTGHVESRTAAGRI